MSRSYAGVDFSMLGASPERQVYTIPEFFSNKEAEQWGNDMKGVEPIRRTLRRHMENILKWAHLEEEDIQYLGRIHRAGRLMTQYGYCQKAFEIMDIYHKHHPNEVGADFYACSIPLKSTKRGLK